MYKETFKKAGAMDCNLCLNTKEAKWLCNSNTKAGESGIQGKFE